MSSEELNCCIPCHRHIEVDLPPGCNTEVLYLVIITYIMCYRTPVGGFFLHLRTVLVKACCTSQNCGEFFWSEAEFCDSDGALIRIRIRTDNFGSESAKSIRSFWFRSRIRNTVHHAQIFHDHTVLALKRSLPLDCFFPFSPQYVDSTRYRT